jgi:small ligand-binding sensory domain FIST
MPFAAALATGSDTIAVAGEACNLIRGTRTDSPDLVFVFFSPQHARLADSLNRAIHDQLAPRCLVGCIAESVIGSDREVEDEAAISMWAAWWGNKVSADPFHLTLEHTADGPSLMGWPDSIVDAEARASALLIVGDPFSLPTDLLLLRVNEDYPGLRIVGGMASGVSAAGQCRLFLDGTVHNEGAVGVLLQGSFGLRPVVSQGCRPIGRPFVVTKGEENVILQLGGKPPLSVLQELWQSLDERDKKLFQQGLHVGRVINEYQSDFQRGDFLIRNVIGLDRTTGALAITDRVRVGQTLQFQVRDAATADEDLHALLQFDLVAHVKPPVSALLFSCNGRGSRLFGVADHDVGVLRAEAGPIPVAGFFAQGELGPVGGQNFIHGFTASVALFEE